MQNSDKKDPPSSGLPADYDGRKAIPLASVLDYFPAALAAVAEVIAAGQKQHGTTGWDRAKSTDESSTLLRHFMDRGKLDTDGIRHSAKVAWRALALLQKEIEAAQNLPISRGSYDSAKQAREARTAERFAMTVVDGPSGRRVDMVPRAYPGDRYPAPAVVDLTGTPLRPFSPKTAAPGSPEDVVDMLNLLFSKNPDPRKLVDFMRKTGAPEEQIAQLEDVIENGCGDPACTVCKDKPRNAGVIPRGATRH